MNRAFVVTPILLMTALTFSWVRGWWRSDALALSQPSGHVWMIALHHGGVLLAVENDPAIPVSRTRVFPTSTREAFVESAVNDGRLQQDWQWLGMFRRRQTNTRVPWTSTVLFIPPWMFGVVAAILVLLPLATRRRHKPGHCRICGYDLRASRDRCPECGTEIPESVIIKSA